MTTLQKKLVLSLFLVFVWIGTVQTSAAQCDAYFLKKKSCVAKLDKRVPQLLDSANIPGLSLAMIKKGRVLYTQAYGVKNTETKEKLNLYTIFEAASLSKPVFAYCCMKFVEKGLLDLDKPLYEYWVYEDIKKAQRYENITARMILSHTSGFPNWRNQDSLGITFEPGQRFSYSGEGYIYLQKVLEKISGKELNEIMTEQVFIPLGMKNSSYVWKKEFDDNFALPHDRFGNSSSKYKDWKVMASSSLHTTSQDYAVFITALLNSKGLRKETIQSMLTPQVKLTEKIFPPLTPVSTSLSWALGMGIQDVRGEKSFWHWGDNGNFKCYMEVNETQKMGIVYFANSYNGLSILKELLQETVRGEQPLIDFIGYKNYKSPGNVFVKHIFTLGVEKAIAPFLDVKGKSTIEEDEMNEMGYQLLSIKRIDFAKEVFDLNKQAYPHSSNAYDSYAESCLKNGDFEEAGKNYLKSFELNPQNRKAKHLADQINHYKTQKGNVEFRLQGYPNAKLVTLAGSFNKWDDLNVLFFKEEKEWICKIDLVPGEYQYKIVIDGNWILDPANSITGESNGYTNSVLKVE